MTTNPLLKQFKINILLVEKITTQKFFSFAHIYRQHCFNVLIVSLTLHGNVPWYLRRSRYIAARTLLFIR